MKSPGQQADRGKVVHYEGAGRRPPHVEHSAVAARGSQPLPAGALRIVAVRCFDAAHGPNTSDDDAGYAAVLRGDVRRYAPRFVARMSLVRDERHDRMDKKNDHSRKHGQRDSFIDASAAKDCEAFHSFPPIQTTVRVPTCCHAALLR